MTISRIASGLFLAGLLTGGLVACGGSSSSSPGSGNETLPPDSLTGVLVDSAVAGIGYRTTTQQGTTNAAGEFDYLDGESVVFFIGDLELPPVPAKGVVTPLDIAGTSDVDHPVVVNIARLLQSLDEDGDPSNGIQIPQAAAAVATQVDFSLTVEEFAAQPAVTTLVANSGSVTTALVSAEDAVAHLEQTVAEYAPSIVGAWALQEGEVDAVLVFFADGTYVHAEAGNDDPNGTNGMERGTYTWNAVTGAFTSPCPGVDTNGQWGLSHSNPDEGCSGTTATVTVDGDNLTFDFGGDDVVTLQRVADAANPIVGAWAASHNDANVVFMFLADGSTYLHAEDGNEDPTGQDGIERGSYTWNQSTGAFASSCPDVDTNGEWGMSHPHPPTCTGTDATVTVVNDEALILEIFDDLLITRKVDRNLVDVEGYTLNLAGKTATSVITSSNCPGAALGWTYTFDEVGMTMVGTDTTNDCVPGDQETIELPWTEVAAIDDIPFNCGGLSCSLEDLNRSIEDIDEDSRPFHSLHWHMPGKTLIYIKSITGGDDVGDSWKEFITLQ